MGKKVTFEIDGGGKLTDLIEKASEKDCHDTGVCSTPEILQLMRDFYKMRTRRNVQGPKVIDLLKKELNVKGEACILKNDKFNEFAKQRGKQGIIENYIKTTIKPSGPRDNNEWLNNFHIDHTFALLEKTHPLFRRIPYQMIDFHTVRQQEETLSDIDFVEEYKKGKRLFGCAINTDTSSGSGIHWFAFFVNLEKKPYTIEFFDSTGRSMDPQVREYAMTLKADLEKAKLPVQLIENRRVHQRENSECGVYTSFYIYARVNGYSFKDFQTEIIPDSEIKKFREGMFSTC